LARRVALITNAPFAERAGGLFSPISSVRREILLPARALEAQGVATQVLSLQGWPREQVRAVVEKADRVIFSAMLGNRDEPAYREAVGLSGAAPRLVFHVGAGDVQRPFYRDVAASSHAFLVHSESARQALARDCACKILVAPLPIESARGVPHVPRRGLRARIGAKLAMRAGVGLDPWRWRLLWAGDASQARTLRDALAELRTFASRVPLYLHCLTDGEDLFAPEGTPASALRVEVEPASPEAMAAGLEACDVVLLPDHATSLDAANAGRLAIVPTELAEVLRHPAAALERLQIAQREVAQSHSPAAISRFWMRALDFASGEDPAPLVAQARHAYEARQLAEAERLLASVLEHESAWPEAHHLLGNIHQDQGKTDRAISCYRRALRLDARFAAAHNDLGTAYAAKGWQAEALECYLQAVRLDSSNEAAQTNLAQTLLKAGRRAEALAHLKAALRLRLGQFLRRKLKISSRRSMP
jgi:hypothetical protein